MAENNFLSFRLINFFSFFPKLEALSCLSYSLSSDGKDQKNVSTAGPHDIFHQILSPFTGDGCNWVLDNVSHQLEVNTKTNIALYYIDSFLRNHRVWSSHSLSKSREVISCHYVYLQEEDLSQMKQDLQMLLSMIERKFLLKSVDIFNLVKSSEFFQFMLSAPLNFI